MPDYQEQQEARDEAREQREHELELKKLEHPPSEWAVTVRVVMVWAVILAALCYLAAIGVIN